MANAITVLLFPYHLQQYHCIKGESTMKLNRILFNAGRLNERQIRLALAIGALALFVLGAGAPGAGSDF